MKPLLALFALLFACSPAVDDDDSAAPPEGPDPLAWDVTDFGPYNVGYATWTHTYTPPGDIGERSIEVHLWYPTEDTSGESVRYLDWFLDENSWPGATPAAPVDEGGDARFDGEAGPGAGQPPALFVQERARIVAPQPEPHRGGGRWQVHLRPREGREA